MLKQNLMSIVRTLIGSVLSGRQNLLSIGWKYSEKIKALEAQRICRYLHTIIPLDIVVT